MSHFTTVCFNIQLLLLNIVVSHESNLLWFTKLSFHEHSPLGKIALFRIEYVVPVSH